MQSQLFAPSVPPVIARSPLDVLAEELGSAAARIERDLRRELSGGMAEIQRELEVLRRHNAELELRIVTAEQARDRAIRDRLATLRDGENGAPGASVTVDDVRPLIAEEIARQREAAPKLPDTDEIGAIAAAEVERRIDDVAKRAADLVPAPEMPPPPELPDIPALIADEISNREDDIVTQAVSRVSETVAEQIQSAIPNIAQRAAEMVPPPEFSDIPALISDELSNREDGIVNQAVSRVSETVVEQIQSAIPDIVQRAAEIVPSPELPDIPALIADEISNRESDIVNQAVSRVSETVAEQIQCAVPDIVKRAAEMVPPPELPDIPALIAEEISTRQDGIVNQAVSRVSETVVEQIQHSVPSIAQRAADLVPVPELPPPPELPDILAIVAYEISNREGDIVNQAVSRVSETVVEQIQSAIPGIAQKASEMVPPPELPDIPALIADEISNREGELAERAAELVKVPVLPDINGMIEHRVAAAFATVRVPQDGADADPVAMAVLAQEKVDEAIAGLASAFISQVEAQAVAETAVGRALDALPAQITVDDLRPVIEAEFARQFETTLKPLDADEIGALAEAAAEVVVDRCLPDIAQRAAGLVPPVETPVAPDISAVVAEAIDGRAEAIAERAAELVKIPDLPDVDAMLDNRVAAAFATILMPRDGADADPAVTEALVRETVREVVADLKTTFVGHAEAEIIAQQILSRGLETLPAGLAIDDVLPALRAEIIQQCDSLKADPIEIERLVVAKIAEIPKPRDGEPGQDGPPGTVDKTELREMVEVTTDEHLSVPDHLVGLVARVGELLSQPFAVVLDTPNVTVLTPRKLTLRTWRDENGNLMAEKIEEPAV